MQELRKYIPAKEEEDVSILLLSIQWLGTDKIRENLLTKITDKIMFMEIVEKWNKFTVLYTQNIHDLMVLFKHLYTANRNKKYVVGYGEVTINTIFNKIRTIAETQVDLMTGEPIYATHYRFKVDSLKGMDKLLAWIDKGRKLELKNDLKNHIEKTFELVDALMEMTSYVLFIVSFLKGKEFKNIIGKTITYRN